MQQTSQARRDLPEGLNGAQYAAVQDAIQQIQENLRLRQWCVEKALSMSSPDPMKLAREIFDFVLPQTAVIEAE